jgi:hypothetical protein
VLAHEIEAGFELPDGILRTPEVGYFRGRIRCPAVGDDVGVDQERHDRMGEGTGGDFDAWLIDEPLPPANDFVGLSAQPGAYLVVIRRREVVTAGGEGGEALVPPRLFTRLGEDKQYLGVAELAPSVEGSTA